MTNRRYDHPEWMQNIQIRAGMVPGFGNEVVAFFEGPGGEVMSKHSVDFGRTVMVEYITFQFIDDLTKMEFAINGIELGMWFPALPYTKF